MVVPQERFDIIFINDKQNINLLLFRQIFLFAVELFSVISFLDDSEQAFNHLFLLNANDTDYAIYTKNQFYYQVHYSLEQVSEDQDSKQSLFRSKSFQILKAVPSPFLKKSSDLNISVSPGFNIFMTQ